MMIPIDKNTSDDEIFLINNIDKSSLEIDDKELILLIEILFDLLIQSIIHFFC